MCGKLTILMLFFKLFQVNKSTKIAIYGGILLCLSTYVPRIGLTFFYCAPHPGEVWGSTVYNRCPKVVVGAIAQSVLAVILDTYLLILPIPVILRLNLAPRKKISTCFVFGFALL